MDRLKVLVVGAGGREHALAWKLAQSARVAEVLVAPGNAGTAREARCRNVPVAAEDVEGLLALAERERIGFTVVGPEAPLAAGLVDRFQAAGQRIFGPSRAAAQLEASKAYAKAFLARHGIPTARYEVHTEVAAAEDCIRRYGAPVVVKADGLAAGKGVVVAATLDEAMSAVRDMLSSNSLGAAGHRVVIEEFLQGEEASFIIVASGEDFVEMASSQDHKRVGDGDTGPNTGGMGAYSPAPVVTEAVRQRVLDAVVRPTLAGLRRDGIHYVGFLYAGLMIGSDGEPRVLEFNCRLGDPETQPLLMRLRSDLLGLLEAAVAGQLGVARAEWDPRPCLGVVMAAAGYPGPVRKGDVIHGLEADFGEAKVFHAGTTLQDGRVLTQGGRVLCVCGLGADIAVARDAAYAAVSRIRWDGEHHRQDIGYRAIARQRGTA